MNLESFVNRIVNTKKSLFCKIEPDETFNSNTLLILCDLKINRKRLVEAWDRIIDVLNENYFDEAENYLTADILDFLMSNEICLVGLGHLLLPVEYLEAIYKKDNNCWEALKNIERIKKKV